MLRKLFATRKRAAVTSAAASVLVCGGIAAAAIIVYSGLSGSVGGKVSNASTVGALTFAPAADTIPVDPGGSGSLNWTVTNADPAHPEKVTAISVSSITTDTSGCAGSNFTANVASLVGYIVPAGATVTDALTSGLSAAASTPAACAGAVVTVNITGTTQTQP